MASAEFMRRLRDFLSQWGCWTSAEIEQVARFMEDNAELIVRTGRLPAVGENVSRPHLKTGFGLYLDQVAEHSSDGRSFRCVSSERVWYRLEEEWKGPFDTPRPVGKIWKRGLPSEE